jgi:RNA polymerase sigma factor (sigma-70 family)
MPPPAEGLATRFVLGPALRTQPDRRLVTLVREGYEAAFEEIVRRYGRPLSRYAASIVGGRSEDVTQDAFSKALLALRRDGAEIDLRPWLFRIVRNTALNDLRDRPPSPELLAETIAGGGNPAEELERREELADLIRRLQALPEPQRAAIVMRELEGLGHEEIAAALGVSGGAARQAIHRARLALRDGAGLLLPLPLLRALLEGSGPGAAEAAAGVAGAGGAARAGVALKATAATVLIAGAVGAGVAIDHGARTGTAEATPPPLHSESRGAVAGGGHGEATGRAAGPERQGDGDGSPSGDSGGTSGRDSEGGGGRGPSHSRSGSSGRGDDGSGKGSGDGGGDSGSGERSGRGSGSGSGDDGIEVEGSTSGKGSGPDGGSGSGSGEIEESLSDVDGSGDSGSSDGSGSSDDGGGGESGSGSSSGSGNIEEPARDSSGGDGLSG